MNPRGNFLGRGFYSPKSAIPVRVLVRDETTKLDGTFFRARVNRAIEHNARSACPATRRPATGSFTPRATGSPGSSSTDSATRSSCSSSRSG